MKKEDEIGDDIASVDFLSPMEGPELVFGLVGPIGTEMKLVMRVLSELLEEIKYNSSEIRVTETFKDIKNIGNLIESPLDERYSSYIDAGNNLRRGTNRQDIMALLSVAAIRKRRAEITGDRKKPDKYRAYILSQFKRPEEIETLRKVYGKGFIQLSAFCSKNIRLDSLTTRISASYYRKKDDEAYKSKAYDLIVRDSDEEEEKFGQRVRYAFPLADVVINADSEADVRNTCERFIRAFFGYNFITPTKDEYGAFASRNASMRSSDLSRQVGAVALSAKGEILSTGCNEVPKAGGGTYWEGDTKDGRDFALLGYDPSLKTKTEILQDVMRRLKEAGWLGENHASKEISELVSEALSEEKPVLKDAQIMNVLEFGRIIHAEMSIISDAARKGISLNDSTLYTTTFPCHNCARHIIAAGIKRVVYIEPYSKSLASELYPDSIHIEGDAKPPNNRVCFEPFIGIGPEKYEEIFSKGKRKDNMGKAVLWDKKSAQPILQRLVPAYLDIEAAVLSTMFSVINKSEFEIDTSPEILQQE